MWNPDNFPRDGIEGIHYNEPLSRHSTWKIGGIADVFVEPDSVEQIVKIVKTAGLYNIPLVVIGNGSNILFSDNGIRGIVLKMGSRFSKYTLQGIHICAEAGIYVPDLARAAARAGLSGLEHTVGIPGSLGGLVCMNGGSQKKSISTNISSVQVTDRLGNLFWLPVEECHFSYRHSSLQEAGHIICKIKLTSSKADPSEIEKEMEDIISTRNRKFPMDLPSCGSVFLSNPELNTKLGAPGKLIEDAGLKGCSIGGAQVSPHHANFIVNRGGAKSTDIIALVQWIRNKVYDKYNVWLSCEIKYIDETGKIQPLQEVK